MSCAIQYCLLSKPVTERRLDREPTCSCLICSSTSCSSLLRLSREDADFWISCSAFTFACSAALIALRAFCSSAVSCRTCKRTEYFQLCTHTMVAARNTPGMLLVTCAMHEIHKQEASSLEFQELQECKHTCVASFSSSSPAAFKSF